MKRLLFFVVFLLFAGCNGSTPIVTPPLSDVTINVPPLTIPPDTLMVKEPTVILDISGIGPRITPVFAIYYKWTLDWSFNCPSESDSFIVAPQAVFFVAKTVNERGLSGTGRVSIASWSGVIKLDVITACSWRVIVTVLPDARPS